jgi:hypothetical protein
MKLRLLILAVILALVSVVPAFAQDETSAPLIFFGRGLHVMDETTRQVTEWNECGDGQGFHLSPTGEWLARLNNSDGLRLCNLKTRAVIDVAAPSAKPAHPYPSYPAWSPDGTQVAWSVGERDGGSHRLYVYDVATGKARMLVARLPPVQRMIPTVVWGQSGILVAVDDRDADKRFALLYSPDGDVLRDDLAAGDYFQSYFWATDRSGKEYLGRYSNYVYGDLVDPLAGKGYLADNVELYSPLAPNGLTVTMRFDAPGAFITLPDGKTLPIADIAPYLDDFVPYLQFEPTNVAIAPDGQAVAFFDLAQVIWRGGKVTPIPDSVPAADGTGVLWGPMAHRIVGEVYSPIG